ncbi:hypothetical protein CIK05_04105 [Bdellovibrio sp. qaytius]|nr:hypothetical protein CIK05_04105 [Bdellovibrio sp. qaytius]
MKKSVMLLVLMLGLPMASQASGCMPGDTYLAEEKIVGNVGELNSYVLCNDNQGCFLSLTGPGYESHDLLPQATVNLTQAQTFGKVATHIYRQYFVSSCAEEVRYVFGVDIDGVRYRDQNDIAY